MKKLLLTSAAVLSLATPAFALNDNSVGNGNALSGSSLVGVGGNNNAPIYSGPGAGASPVTSTATGGAGGAGGAGGSATALSGDSTSAVVGSGNSLQGQSQQAATGDQSVSISNERGPASTAFAAPLVASEDTCMGSSSAGAQGVGFGLSLGSTWKDADCVRRKDARELRAMGLAGASVALMCHSDGVREAMAEAGTPCPARLASSAAQAAPAYPTSTWENASQPAKH